MGLLDQAWFQAGRRLAPCSATDRASAGTVAMGLVGVKNTQAGLRAARARKFPVPHSRAFVVADDLVLDALEVLEEECVVARRCVLRILTRRRDDDAPDRRHLQVQPVDFVA